MAYIICTNCQYRGRQGYAERPGIWWSFLILLLLGLLLTPVLIGIPLLAIAAFLFLGGLVCKHTICPRCKWRHPMRASKAQAQEG